MGEDTEDTTEQEEVLEEEEIDSIPETEVLDSEVESDLTGLEVEISNLEDKLKEELTEEVDAIEEEFAKLKDGLDTAKQLEEQLGKLEEELASVSEEKEKYINRLQRLQADFSNYKKRVTKEKEKISKQTTKDFVADLLPIIDNFERALDTSGDSKEVADVLEGVEMIHRQLTDLLENNDVEKIATVGKEFDPNFHQAVMNEASDEYESGVITEELQAGYKLEDLVIRPAMVRVAE
ncbi:nucleotide exchange factor GrpE [Halanaerobaculum tunisiense]